MDISEVARRAGVAASTLRFYEKKGLISATRSEGGRRHFAPGVLERLAMVAMGQAAGLSLDEIRAMLSPSGEPRMDRALLQARADDIDAAIRRMQAMSHSLRRAAACTASSHTECQTFQRLLKVAAAGRLKPQGALLRGARPALDIRH